MTGLAPVTVGTIKTKFGIEGTSTFGIIESITNNQTAEKLEVKNSQGQIIGAVYHGHKIEITVEATFLVEGTPTGPNIDAPIGTEITIPDAKGGTIVAIVDSVSISASSSDNVKLSISATIYPDLAKASSN